MTFRRRVLYLLVSTLVVPTFAILSLELVLYLFNVPSFAETERGKSISSFQDCRSLHVGLQGCVAPPKPPHKKSIFIYGESTVQGFQVATEERFSDVLQKRLGDSYSVVNFGHSCKDSLFIRECVRQTISAKPDYVVLYAGHNDFSNLFHPKSAPPWLRNNKWAWRAVVGVRNRSRIYAVMSRTLLNLNPEHFPFQTLREFKERHERVVDEFIGRLKDIKDLTEKNGGHLIVMTPGSNLKEFRSLERNYPDPLFRELLALSWSQMQKGDEAFKRGEFSEALQWYRRARDNDPVPSRATDAFNDALRRFAEKRPEVLLVDFESYLFSRYAREGIGCNLFGSEKYCDQFHPNPEGHRLIAELLYPHVK